MKTLIFFTMKLTISLVTVLIILISWPNINLAENTGKFWNRFKTLFDIVKFNEVVGINEKKSSNFRKLEKYHFIND